MLLQHMCMRRDASIMREQWNMRRYKYILYLCVFHCSRIILVNKIYIYLFVILGNNCSISQSTWMQHSSGVSLSFPSRWRWIQTNARRAPAARCERPGHWTSHCPLALKWISHGPKWADNQLMSRVVVMTYFDLSLTSIVVQNHYKCNTFENV